jgi:ligand-binding sensor domain-containing protein
MSTPDSGRVRITALVADQSGALWLSSDLGVGKPLLRSTDQGTSWLDASDGLPTGEFEVLTRAQDIDPLTGDPAKVYQRSRTETRPLPVTALIQGGDGVWYAGMLSRGIFSTQRNRDEQ